MERRRTFSLSSISGSMSRRRLRTESLRVGSRGLGSLLVGGPSRRISAKPSTVAALSGGGEDNESDREKL